MLPNIKVAGEESVSQLLEVGEVDLGMRRGGGLSPTLPKYPAA